MRHIYVSSSCRLFMVQRAAASTSGFWKGRFVARAISEVGLVSHSTSAWSRWNVFDSSATDDGELVGQTGIILIE
jgi:hypothetical protein